MGIDLPATTEGPVEPMPSETPIKPAAQARPKRAAKSTSPKAKAAATAPLSVTPGSNSVAESPKKPRKPAAKRTSKPAEKKKSPATKKKPARITSEHVAIRAFLVWEKRSQQGLPGDEVSDWVEAERQLLAERSSEA